MRPSRGGNGGAGAVGGANGAGGVGITGSGLNLIITSSVTGGLSGDGVTLANSIVNTGSAATLGVQNGAVITGDVSLGNFANGVTLETGGTINGALNIGTSTAATLALTGTGTQTYSTAVTGPTTFSGTLTKTGTGTWTLDQTFNYSGSTTVQDGTLQLGIDNALPTGTTVTLNSATGFGNALLDLNGHAQTIAGLTFVAPESGSIVDVNGGVLTLAGNVNVVNNISQAGNGEASLIRDTAGGGALDLGGATRTFSIAGQNVSTDELEIDAVIQGNGGVVIECHAQHFQ